MLRGGARPTPLSSRHARLTGRFAALASPAAPPRAASPDAPSVPCDHRQIDEARGPAGVEHLLGRLLIISGSCEEYVLYIGLGVAVVEREPARLHLHHEAVARQEDVIHLWERKAVQLDLARRYGARMTQALAVAAAKDIHCDGQLIAAHLRIRRHFIGIHVDEFQD